MPVSPYKYNGPIDHTLPIDRSKARGKSVIITGGANGMDEATLRAFVAVGAFVTFGDVNDRGREIEKELNDTNGKSCVFVKCDIRNWEEQKAMFDVAKQSSPAKSVDVVIANAGISRSSGDSMWVLDGWCLPLRSLGIGVVANWFSRRGRRADKAGSQYHQDEPGGLSIHF